MTIRYFPFASGTGTSVDETKWSDMAQLFRATGIIPGYGNEFEVYADSSGMQVKVKTGTAIIEGHFVDNDAEVITPISASDPSNPRIDRVVLRVDWVNDDIAIEVLTGTPAASPTAPTLTQTSSVWEISLCQVLVAAAASTISASAVTDEREFSLANFDSAQMGDRGSVTISSGAITVKSQAGVGFYKLAGEGAAADTLTNINTSNPKDGMLLVVTGQSGYNITIEDTGNINLGPLTLLVINHESYIILVYDDTNSEWNLMGPSYAGVKSFWIPALAFTVQDSVNTLPDLINSVHPVLSFIDAASDYAVINMELPSDYNGGNITFYIWWIAGAAQTNSVVWQLALDMLADGEAYSAMDDTDTVVDAAQGSATEVLRSGPITLTPTWVAGDNMVLRVGRLGTDGSDTLTSDAHLIGVKALYTTNKAVQS